MNERFELQVRPMFNNGGDPMGYAVFAEDGIKSFRIGPNPLTKEASSKVLGVIQRLGLNLATDTDKRTKTNERIVKDGKLRDWLMNRI